MKHAVIYGFIILLWVSGTVVMAQQPSAPAPPHAILLDGHALVPVRPLAEALGATLRLDTATNAVTLTRDATTLTLMPYRLQIPVNTSTVQLPAPPILRAGQLFVPVREVADAFGATVGLHGGTNEDSAKRVAVTYQGETTTFRAVEAGRMLTADFTGNGQAASAFAVANIPGIDAYNSPYLSDIVPLDVWVTRNNRTLWRTSLAKGVSLTRFTATDVTGDRTLELSLTYFTRHSYMGPYPGSIYTEDIFGWEGGTMQRLLALDYSRDHGRLYREPATLGKAAAFILVDTNWRHNEDNQHYIAELYAWNGRRFPLAARRVVSSPITSETAARRLLHLLE